MCVFLRYLTSIILTLATSRAFAQVFGDVPESGDFSHTSDRVPSVVYKSAEVGKVLPEILSATPAANMAAAERQELKSRFFRVDNRVTASESSDTLMSNDRATFSLNTPTRGVNNALSFVGTVTQSALSSTTTKLIQVLSMLSSGKANFQFAYLAPFSRDSHFESNVDCRVSNMGGNMVVVARLQYVVNF